MKRPTALIAILLIVVVLIAVLGLRIFLNVLKNAKVQGSKVYLRGVNDDIREVLTMTGFNCLFEFK